MFSNIPSDGYVKVSIKHKPDLSKKGITRAVLEFSVDGIEKNGKAIVMIDVKNPVKDEAKPSYISSENHTRAAAAVPNLDKPTQVTDPATVEKERMGQ